MMICFAIERIWFLKFNYSRLTQTTSDRIETPPKLRRERIEKLHAHEDIYVMANWFIAKKIRIHEMGLVLLKSSIRKTKIHLRERERNRVC